MHPTPGSGNVAGYHSSRVAGTAKRRALSMATATWSAMVCITAMSLVKGGRLRRAVGGPDDLAAGTQGKANLSVSPQEGLSKRTAPARRPGRCGPSLATHCRSPTPPTASWCPAPATASIARAVARGKCRLRPVETAQRNRGRSLRARSTTWRSSWSGRAPVWRDTRLRPAPGVRSATRCSRPPIRSRSWAVILWGHVPALRFRLRAPSWQPVPGCRR
jgi:hypothetical protein